MHRDALTARRNAKDLAVMMTSVALVAIMAGLVRPLIARIAAITVILPTSV